MPSASNGHGSCKLSADAVTNETLDLGSRHASDAAGFRLDYPHYRRRVLRLADGAVISHTLPGYRERIVHVVLKPHEGGLNLAMEEVTIRKLVSYGKKAGETLRNEFNLDAHRWRRFLIAMARMEETLDEVASAYEGTANGPEPFADFLARYAEYPDHYLMLPKGPTGSGAPKVKR
jgi:hypothetical protein